MWKNVGMISVFLFAAFAGMLIAKESIQVEDDNEAITFEVPHLEHSMDDNESV
ncbi:hypothetical protein [Geomicrobium sp. JCM 19055]|uniref:hypothetical protein n=1 Tax=Geomicrobium sp. JCM 19055 TaxID=1460649 RepID=UPI00187CCCB0|nr:hypothetical protein [Geomicrobium sp. JCM 19055]